MFPSALLLWIHWIASEDCYPWGLWIPFYLGCPPLNSGIACLAYLNPGIAWIASQSSDWLGALWASLSGVQSSVTFVRLNVIDHCWSGMFNYPASTCWLIDCALTHSTSAVSVPL